MHDLDFATADIETDPFADWETPDQQLIPVAFCAGLYYRNESFIWWGEDCLAKLAKKATELDTVVYMHNGGGFDFHYLLPHINAPKAEFLLIGKRIVQIKFEHLKRSLEYRDSYALIPRPLRDWGKDEIDYNKLRRNVREKHKEEIISYLTRDLTSLESLVKSAQKRTRGDYLTQASSAFSKLKEKIGEKLPHISENFDDKFRPYYYAGRVQTWRYGKIDTPISVYDINSAFPHSMLSPHWWGNEYESQKEEPTAWLEQSFVCLECHAEGCFPLRVKDKVEYPTGRYKFKVTGWEYAAAKKLGLIRDVEIVWFHVPSEVLSYEDFVLPLYEEKLAAEKAGDAASRLFSKLELNSAYGKFGQDPDNYREVICRRFGHDPNDEPKNGGGGTIAKDDEDAGFTFWQRPAHGPYNPKPKFFNNVAVAASITGKVRATLLHAIHRCKAIYCDTDSVFVPTGSGGGLSVGSGLGQWKHEFDFAPGELWLGGRKLYAGKGVAPGKTEKKWKYAAKGVKLTPENIVRVCEGETVESRFAAPSFSLLSGTKFISRRVRRLDLGK